MMVGADLVVARVEDCEQPSGRLYRVEAELREAREGDLVPIGL